MTERRVRRELTAVTPPLPDTAALATGAMARGRTVLRRRRAVRRALTTTSVAFAAVAAFAVVPGAAPAEAAVSCLPGRVVASGRAALRHDGARVTVTNATGEVVRVVAGDVGTFVPPGRSAVTMPLRPGRVDVSCDTSPTAASLTVHDPRGLYVDDRVGCETSEVRDLRGDGAVRTGDPLALTRQHLTGLPPRVAVEPAGHPGATQRRTVRVRDGDTVLAVALWRAMPGPGAWVLDEVRLCPPLDLA